MNAGIDVGRREAVACAAVGAGGLLGLGTLTGLATIPQVALPGWFNVKDPNPH